LLECVGFFYYVGWGGGCCVVDYFMFEVLYLGVVVVYEVGGGVVEYILFLS